MNANYENGEIRPISVQGQASGSLGITIYAPQKGNRAIISSINFNWSSAFTLSLYRHSALTGNKILLYNLSLEARDIIDDSIGYTLMEGDYLYIVPHTGSVNYSIEGFEYEKNCITPPATGRGQLRVVDSAGNFKGIGAQGPAGPAGAPGPTLEVDSEGSVLGNATIIDFTGSGVSVFMSAGRATVNIPNSGGGGSVTSAEFLSLESRVSLNSAQMTSADNAISNAVSVLSTIVSGVVSNVASLSLALSVLSTAVSAETANRISADNALSNAVSVVSAQVATNSAQMTSADNAISNAVSIVSVAAASKNTIIAIQHEGSGVISNPAILNYTGNAVSLLVSAGVTKINISATAGGASVTSANFVSLRSVVQANSAQMTSADNTNSAAIAALSAQHTSLAASVAGALSAIAANSAQMTSADNAISNAVSIVSVAQAATSAAVTSVNQAVSALSANVAGISLNISALSTRISVLSTQVATNSAQMTSADNAISNAVSVVSVAVVQEASVRSVQAISIMSAVAVNSAQMTSADNAISNAVSIVSVAQAATSADLTSVKNIVSVLSARVDSNSADFTSFKQSINNIGDISISSPVSTQFLGYDSATGQWLNKSVPSGGGGSVTSVEYTSLVNRVSGNSTQMVSADNAISAAVVALSAQHTSLAASVAGALSAIAANSAQMTSADNAISNAVSVVSAAVVQEASVRSVQAISIMSAVSVNSAQMTSADNAISNAVSIVSVAQAATSAAVTSVNNRVSAISADFTSFKQSLNNFGDVSISVPTDGQVLMYNASAGQWFNSAVAAGTGSVTSTELSAAVAALSNSISVVSAAVVSVQSAVSTLQYPAIESVASAVYSVVEADRGKIKYFTNATSIEVILGNGLTSGFQAVIWRGSAAGELKLSATTTLESQGTVLSSINTAATIIHKGSNVWLAAGAFAGGGTGGGSVTSAELSAVSAAAASGNATLSARINSVAAGSPFLNTQIRIVSSMQSTAGSALVAISGMVLTVAANETWRIEGFLLVSTSATTAGLRAGFSVPPLSLPRYAKFIAGSAGQSATIAGGAGQLAVSGQSITLSITGIGPAGAAVPVKFDALFNVASAGTVNLMACGIASTAVSPLHIMAGTYMICYRLK